jgi:hypothetical protein
MNEQQQLLDSVYKKFQTTMIGALAKFEDNFGHLWDSDTLESERFEMVWEDTRNSILNNGNKQARLALNEISKFMDYNGDKPNKYHYKFYFNKNKGDGYDEN